MLIPVDRIRSITITVVFVLSVTVATTRAFPFFPSTSTSRQFFQSLERRLARTTARTMSSTSAGSGGRRRTSPRKKPATDFFVANSAPSSATASPVTSATMIPSTVSSSTTSTSISTTTTTTNTTVLEDWISHKDASFHHFAPDEAAQIRRALLDWYRSHRRKLPWRGDPPPYDGSTAGMNNNGNSNNESNGGASNNSKKKKAKTTTATTTIKHYNKDATKHYEQSAYGTWVSEIMLQQTRVEAVIPYWLQWMEAFPTPQALAQATEEQVNARWAGLGFYRRARLLHAAAKHVTEHYDGQLPQTVAELERIPGIGPYTAAAIASIAFGVSVPVVDGNVCRVLSRLRGVANHIKAPIFKDKLAWELAAQIVHATSDKSNSDKDAGDVNQALMELGATYCAPSGTGVDDNDPLKDFYMSTQLGAAYCQQVVLQPPTSQARKHLQALMMDQATTQSTNNSNNHEQSSCALCDQQARSTVLEQLAESIECDQGMTNEGNDSDNILEAAKRCGHSVFPTAPPKQSKREEVLAVAVISTTLASAEKKAKAHTIDDNTYWLLVKRPKKGLLAGQWEFPSTCVWNSDTDTTKESSSTSTGDASKGKKGVKRKAPPSSSTAKTKKTVIEIPKIGPSARQKALVKLMDDILTNNDAIHDELDNKTLKKLKGSPLEHVFSHVRHTMWIDHASVAADVVEPIEWVSSTEREVKWMRESDMKKAGVTSGVKKILKAVKEEQQKSNKKQGFFQPKSKTK